MTIITLKPDALTVPDFDFDTIYPHMGNNENSAVIMEAPIPQVQWAWRGYFGMGYYLHGSNLNTTFLTNYDITDVDPVVQDRLIAAKAAIKTTWANRLIPWFVAIAASDNTCSNAAVRITGAQCYTLDDTGAWARQGYTQAFPAECSGYTIVAGATSAGYASAKLYNDTINVPAFPFCPTVGDWSGAQADTGKYRYLHAATMGRIVLSDPSALRGVLVTFESQIVSTNGLALNGTPKFLIQAGCDAGYDDWKVGDVGGLLEGAPYSPALFGSRWSYANVDGTRRRHYGATFMHADSSEDLTSDYNAAGGISKSTAAQFAANMPRRVYQRTI